jgi:hypothetical protein
MLFTIHYSLFTLYSLVRQSAHIPPHYHLTVGCRYANAKAVSAGVAGVANAQRLPCLRQV